MRTKKAIINSAVNIISFIMIFIPNLIIRKTFLNYLGSDLLGLNSLYNNIIGWLSIVEMGVGSAIIFSLYKPFVKNDKKMICSYIRFYGFFYRTVGLIILVSGLIISPFLKLFIKGEMDHRIVILGFLLYLINTLITYLFSHRLCILTVAQEEYKITIGTTITKLIILLIQFCLFRVYPNFILFIIVQVVINLIYFILINLYVNSKFPWIKIYKENLEREERSRLLINVKAMFMHKIGSLVVTSTDSIVISKFVGLTSLANYSNYETIIRAVQTLIGTGLNGITASIGNMLVDSNESKAYEIHKKIFFLNFWVVSFVTISMYNTLNQFIALWVGEKYLIDNLTFIIILINMYFAAMRGSVEQFQSGSGNFYQDRYAPICEGIINLVFSIVLVKYMGIAGVFLGTLISNFLVIFWTKPYVVYKYIFKKNLKYYFIMYFKYLFIGICTLILTNYLTLTIKYDYKIINFLINCAINCIVINIIYIIIFFRTKEFRYYVNLFKGLLTKK